MHTLFFYFPRLITYKMLGKNSTKIYQKQKLLPSNISSSFKATCVLVSKGQKLGLTSFSVDQWRQREISTCSMLKPNIQI